MIHPLNLEVYVKDINFSNIFGLEFQIIPGKLYFFFKFKDAAEEFLLIYVFLYYNFMHEDFVMLLSSY